MKNQTVNVVMKMWNLSQLDYLGDRNLGMRTNLTKHFSCDLFSNSLLILLFLTFSSCFLRCVAVSIRDIVDCKYKYFG